MALSFVDKQAHHVVHKLIPYIIKNHDRSRVGDRVWFVNYGHWNPWSAVEGVVEAHVHKNTALISDRGGRLHKRSVKRITRRRAFTVPVTFDFVKLGHGWVRFRCPVCRVYHYHLGGGHKIPKCIGRMNRCFSDGYFLQGIS